MLCCLSAIRFQRKKRKSASDLTYRCDYNRDIILTFPFIDDFYNLFYECVMSVSWAAFTSSFYAVGGKPNEFSERKSFFFDKYRNQLTFT